MSQSIREERRARMSAAMADSGFDVIAVLGNAWRSDYLRYVADVIPLEGHAVAFVERDGATRLLLDSRSEAARIAAERADLSVGWVPSAIIEAEAQLQRYAQRRLGLAPQAAVPLRLARGPLGGSIGAATAMLDRIMLYKTPAEVEAVRRAAGLADEGYQVFREAARVGRAEYELVADVEAFYRSRGCPDNFQILGSGGREVRGMHPPGERRIAAGDLVTTELTPCVEGYYAQICRTLVVGAPTEAQQRAFAVYREALEAGIAAVRPGVTAADVARAENEVFRRHGLGEYVTSEYTRVRGHGLGLYPDSRPQLLEDVDVVLEADMTIIVHPNTFHPEVGYIVLGDALRVTPTGCEVLIRTPRELFSQPQ